MRNLLTWPAFGTRTVSRVSPSDASLQRVAGRLAAQTVLLLLVMLVILGIIAYFKMHQTLVASLEKTLRTRAAQADPTACQYFHLECRGVGLQPQPRVGPGGGPGLEGRGQPDESGGQEPPSGGDGTSPPIFQPVQGPSDASTVYVNRDLLIIDHDGNLGSHLLSEADIERAMQSRSAYCCSSHTYRHQTYLVYSAPLIVHGDVRGAVQISISEHQLQQAMNGLLQSLLVVGLLGIIGSGAISVALAGRALQPIRLAMQRQRDFVADAAHELRTPLAIQRTVAEVELPEPTVEDLQSTVAQMLGENRHLTRLVEDLSLLARADTDAIGIERQPVDLSSLLARTSEEIGYLANDRGVALKADVQGSVTVIGDVVRLRQLILILLDNAMKHTPVGGTIAVSLSTEGNRAVVRVADTGAGIAPADLPRVFDRFYRSDQARVGEGTGLGLAIAQWIVGAHGGHISAGNAVPNGAIFTVTLPQARGPAGA